jgi:hypothetical protein
MQSETAILYKSKTQLILKANEIYLKRTKSGHNCRHPSTASQLVCKRGGMRVHEMRKKCVQSKTSAQNNQQRGVQHTDEKDTPCCVTQNSTQSSGTQERKIRRSRKTKSVSANEMRNKDTAHRDVLVVSQYRSEDKRAMWASVREAKIERSSGCTLGEGVGVRTSMTKYGACPSSQTRNYLCSNTAVPPTTGHT